jgi:hypothetical protein
MKRNDFIKLRIGDMVEITQEGKNRGKIGIIKDIIRVPGKEGVVYLSPFNCDFEFHGNSKIVKNKDGFYGWKKSKIKTIKESK